MELVQDAVVEALVDSTRDVFETVVFMSLRAEEVIDDAAEIDNLNLSAFICLAGQLSGLVAVHCSTDLACEITQTATCDDGPQLSATQLRDAVGEMANMIAGNLKRRFSKDSDLFEIAVPSVIEGQSLRICHAGSKSGFPRLLVPFVANEEHRFYVELQYKPC